MRSFSYECAVVSHIGNRRKKHEDNFFIGELLTSCEQASLSQQGNNCITKRRITDNSRNRVFAVTDGMGGHRDGEVASCMAAEALSRFTGSRQEKACCGRQDKFAYVQAFQDMIRQTNRAMLAYPGTEGGAGQMGATLSGAILFADEIVPFNIGDSSTFLFENHALRKLTVDDNEAQRLRSIGNVGHVSGGKGLTRYFGLPESCGVLTARISDPIPMRDGQILLISSDGMTDCLSEETIAAILAGEPGDAGTMAGALLEQTLAAEGGGHDNITVVVVKIQRERGKKFPAIKLPLGWKINKRMK